MGGIGLLFPPVRARAKWLAGKALGKQNSTVGERVRELGPAHRAGWEATCRSAGVKLRQVSRTWSATWAYSAYSSAVSPLTYWPPT